MSKMSQEKARATAANLREAHVERKTGQCPWGCGKDVTNGGDALLAHLSVCHGNRRIDARVRRVPR
jgi:hypothetical protein